jgi:hypothetical protein
MRSDGAFEPNVLRVVYDPSSEWVYVEIEAKHDGTHICHSVRVARSEVSDKVRNVGGLL